MTKILYLSSDVVFSVASNIFVFGVFHCTIDEYPTSNEHHTHTHISVISAVAVKTYMQRASHTHTYTHCASTTKYELLKHQNKRQIPQQHFNVFNYFDGSSKMELCRVCYEYHANFIDIHGPDGKQLCVTEILSKHLIFFQVLVTIFMFHFQFNREF